jgi:DNA polymerase I-like protein with 3'-5' exonuclease and polymerase domains
MRIALDIETNLSHNTIHLCVTKHLETGEVKVWKNPNGLNDYLSKATLLIAHNGIAFDFYHLNRLWNTKISLKKTYDTLVASRLLEPTKENGHSLESYGKQLGIPKIDYPAVWSWMMNRREEYPGECYDKPIEGLLEYYCTRDVDVLARAFYWISDQLESKGFSADSLELEHQVAAIIAQQERNGFKLDTIHATCLLTDLKTKMAGIYEQMQERWPPVTIERVSEKTGKRLKDEVITFNPGSRQQIGEKLIELGWKPKKLTPTGQPIVDEDTLKGILFPEGQIIAEYLLLQKRIAQVESWLEAMGSDGRVHGKVITNGAVTGRMTHSKPNMAQIPNAGSLYGPECRQCWTVENGNVLVGCDASGLELRMLAHYMKDENYVRTVTEGSSKDGTDVHTVNQRAAGLATRDLAKTFIYAFLYGAGDAKIGSIVGGSARDGALLKDKFLKQTPALGRLISTVAKYAEKGFVPGLDGRRIWVRSEHAALNSLLQGAGAIVMKKALVIFNDKIKINKWPVKLVANVHDEFQFEVPAHLAEVTGEAAKQSIIEAGVFYKLRCPLNGEYKYGANWRETH